MFEKEKRILPPFPRTKHLPYKPNASINDLIATEEEVKPIFGREGLINIEEKIDGASIGICLHPELGLIIRNKDHILRKGYYKETAAKEQFKSIWNWYYKNEDKFKILNVLGPYAVYGEWCVAQHGIYYNRLPDWFIAYDVFDYEEQKFLAPPQARKLLKNLGFSLPHLWLQGMELMDYRECEFFTNFPSRLIENTENNMDFAEGIYLKTYDENYVVDRFKMVRQNFIRGALWNPKKIKKNKLVR